MLALTILSVLSTYILTPSLAHEHPAARALPDTWYHSEDHPAYELFKRGPTDGATYPTVGSAEWTASYPAADQSIPIDTSKIPQAWLDALKAAVAAGKIPNLPISTQPGGPYTTPVYNGGALKFDDPSVCSGNAETCRMPGDIWDAPAGVLGVGFDDGPTPNTDKLLDFLASNKQAATHFFIGSNIIRNPTQFMKAFNNGDDIAVHTWTHPHLTTLSNEAIVGELGWTMKVIHDSTGGRLPRYWRPPTGDTDYRVHGIATAVFGLTTIMWNQDTTDYEIPGGGQTSAKVAQLFNGWLHGPKSPGLIILEHELYPETVAAFIAAWPEIKSTGWNTISQARMYNYTGSSWQNSKDNNSPVTAVKDIIVGASGSGSGTGGSSAAGGGASSSASSVASSGSMVKTTSASGTASTTASASSRPSAQATGGATALTSLPMQAVSAMVGVAGLMMLL